MDSSKIISVKESFKVLDGRKINEQWTCRESNTDLLGANEVFCH